MEPILMKDTNAHEYVRREIMDPLKNASFSCDIILNEQITPIKEISEDFLIKAEKVLVYYSKKTHLSLWKHPDRGEKKVLEKEMLNASGYDQNSDSFKEMINMDKLRGHRNIAMLYGVVIQDPLKMIMEYYETTLFQHVSENVLNSDQLLNYSIQIATGMKFIASKSIIHGKLSANNILITDDARTIKISEFGYSRSEVDNENEKPPADDLFVRIPYVDRRRGHPKRAPNQIHYHEQCFECELQRKTHSWWWAPEVTHENIFSTKGDVWSFGVTIWEIYTHGGDPKEIASLTAISKFLPRPEDCPEKIYEKVTECWKIDRERRPNFSQLLEFMKEQEEENESDPIKTKDVASLASNSDSPEMFQEHHDGPTIIQYEDLQIIKELGRGNFGSVSQANWVPYSKLQHAQNKAVEIPCVVKKLYQGDSNEMRNEILNMRRLGKHDNVVILYGIVFMDERINKIEGFTYNVVSPRLRNVKSSILLVSEYCNGGSLEARLLDKENPLSNEQLKDFARQIACGMEYLCRMGFVHRDLAARNIMLHTCLNGEQVARVGDFGLARFKYKRQCPPLLNCIQVLATITRFIGLSKLLPPFLFRLNTRNNYPYYKPVLSKFIQLPTLWWAPEVAEGDQVYTEKADVWSYGVLLWEMFSHGRIPTSNRLRRPLKCPKEVYQIMMRCWEEDPKQRPSFSSIKNFPELNNEVSRE